MQLSILRSSVGRILSLATRRPVNLTTFSNYSTKTVKFISGSETFVGSGREGDTLLDVVINNDLPLDGFGACEGTLACCTCHVILTPEHFQREDDVNPASEEEMDLLDLAPDLSDQSRLGCQIKLLKEDTVIEVVVPTAKRDARALD
ncbi:unnamed protein product [Auanema sp. JU1783]|nr:unnamed protein product [Auanema sp. JU1783]